MYECIQFHLIEYQDNGEYTAFSEKLSLNKSFWNFKGTYFVWCCSLMSLSLLKSSEVRETLLTEDRQTDRHTDRQTHTHRRTDTQTDKQADRMNE